MVLAACSGFGWQVLVADEFTQFMKHVAGGAGFASNFVLWRESGYFDAAADTKPLLHLWSLGIEEQYYIVWPLLLWLAWKRRFNLLAITVALAAVSFEHNLATYRIDVVANFYSPQTRSWELLAGSALAYATLHGPARIIALRGRLAARLRRLCRLRGPGTDGSTVRNAQSALGALSIAVGLLVITRQRHFPGFWAVLPVLGAVLIISAGPRAWLNRAVLSNRILVWFGLISFPLYLWHWPLLSFSRIIEGGTPGRATRIAAVLASIALAWLTYRLVELPLRFGGHARVKSLALLATMLVFGAAGYAISRSDSRLFRRDERSQFLAYFENSRPEMRYFHKIDYFSAWRPECAFYDLQASRDMTLEGSVRDSPPREALDRTCYERDERYERAVLLWGDSHAQQLAPGLRDQLPGGWQVLQVASPGCYPDLRSRVPSATSQCDQSNYFALKTIATARPDVVVVAQMAGHSLENFRQIAAQLRELGVERTVFVGPTPQWTTDLPRLVVRKLWHAPRRTLVGLRKDVVELDARLKAGFRPDDGAKFASVIDVFCDTDGCLTYLGDDRKLGLTSWDYGHLTPVASKHLAANLLAGLVTGRE